MFMRPINFFRECVIEELKSTLGRRGYQFREEFASLSPPQVPDDFYLPFTSTLDGDKYAHVILMHSYVPRDQEQELDVLLLRYEGAEPWEALATPIPGRSRTNITGYLPGPMADPLPLIRGRHMARQQWKFHSESELRSQLRLICQRLENVVLSWPESPDSTQFMHVEKDWYCEPFKNYLAGVWDAATAYATIQSFERPGFEIEVGDADETYLVNEVVRILYQLQLPEPIKRPNQILLDSLLECLQGQQQFSIIRYREIKAALLEAKKRKR
jgi:hypothetical protein